jgi:hypothetical protein
MYFHSTLCAIDGFVEVLSKYSATDPSLAPSGEGRSHLRGNTTIPIPEENVSVLLVATVVLFCSVFSVDAYESFIALYHQE